MINMTNNLEYFLDEQIKLKKKVNQLISKVEQLDKKVKLIEKEKELRKIEKRILQMEKHAKGINQREAEEKELLFIIKYEIGDAEISRSDLARLISKRRDMGLRNANRKIAQLLSKGILFTNKLKHGKVSLVNRWN
jgi:septal ring factor EnvC (AmiA/AmiB activator)